MIKILNIVKKYCTNITLLYRGLDMLRGEKIRVEGNKGEGDQRKEVIFVCQSEREKCGGMRVMFMRTACRRLAKSSDLAYAGKGDVEEI